MASLFVDRDWPSPQSDTRLCSRLPEWSQPKPLPWSLRWWKHRQPIIHSCLLYVSNGLWKHPECSYVVPRGSNQPASFAHECVSGLPVYIPAQAFQPEVPPNVLTGCNRAVPVLFHQLVSERSNRHPNLFFDKLSKGNQPDICQCQGRYDTLAVGSPCVSRRHNRRKPENRSKRPNNGRNAGRSLSCL